MVREVTGGGGKQGEHEETAVSWKSKDRDGAIHAGLEECEAFGWASKDEQAFWKVERH